MRVRHERVERPEVHLVRFSSSSGAVAVGVEAETFCKPGAVRALDGFAKTLDGRQDLLREVVLVVYVSCVSGVAHLYRNNGVIPILCLSLSRRTSSGCIALSA